MATYTTNTITQVRLRNKTLLTAYRPNDEALAALKRVAKYVGRGTWVAQEGVDPAEVFQAFAETNGVVLLGNEKDREEWRSFLDQHGWMGKVAWNISFMCDKTYLVADSVHQLYEEVERMWNERNEK